MNIPLSVTVIGLLDGPVKLQITLLTLNVQFLSVVNSCRFEQSADMLSFTEQSPQSKVTLYCTVGQLESICDQLNVSSPRQTSVRLTLSGAC